MSLNSTIANEDRALSWLQKLKITVGSARGVMFLHAFPQGSIVHPDVKPENILLGANLEAKLSDFRLSKVMNLGESSASSETRGSFGYVDPDYQTSFRVSVASDVYSFGVVLLQILSGRKVIDMNMKQPKPLDKIARFVAKTGKLAEFANPKQYNEYSYNTFVDVFELGLSCTTHKQKCPSVRRS